jgi:hypothetical protein
MVIAAMPALAAAYAVWPTLPMSPAPELVLIKRASTDSPAFARSRQYDAA